MKVGIVSTGLGNIASIRRMLERVNANVHTVANPKELMDVEAIILPGVGHFDEGIRALHRAELINPLLDRVYEAKIPILGICLGMQLLCIGSEEGSDSGLGLINAHVQRFRFTTNQNLKVPHMGWNRVNPKKPNPLVKEAEEQRFYFVHSYHVVPTSQDIIIGVCDYGGDFCAAFQKDNIFGVQFHPEKSHRFGLALLENFMNYSCNA